MEYSILKLIHIGALVFWLGPSLGAWLAFRAIVNMPISESTSRVNRLFYIMVTVEHIAFVGLLITGLMMALQIGWLQAPWLQQKLFIVLLIVVPIEIVDILLGNWLAAKSDQKKYAGEEMSSAEKRWLYLYHGPFTKLAMFTIPLSALTIMFLAVSKISIELP
ncbi:DUF2269 domain-containing protein [Vibrio coralliilyticus]|uniref:DUF2269 domain-containing protein n=1 Tax=Vibrio coralliilyticus TaxID=190893 RepID=UPI0015603EA2|nr:DUF2269 domain-containing protein [Vibrio coralliilyticus]NRF28138.1 DUF2269 domain-containing protein [Vibrio coralliilyticus]NRF82262.1 DUF2269 domain-containing protein [Vibrio coralliilyticus]